MQSTAALPALEFFLDNGLKVVFVPAAAAPVATLLLVYRIGARNEAVGYTGSSHLLEHMLFKGTATNNRRTGRAFADIMNEIGAAKNATTWIDRTNYFESVPSGYLDFAIELEADRMRGAFVADADRRSEMTVVRNELERNDNNSMRVLGSAVVAAAFREHPYHHPTIGWRSDVEGVPTERLRALYDTYYQPNNATAFVVGDFDAERTRAMLERHFGAIPAASHAIPDVHTEEPPQAGERTVVVKRPGETAIVAFAFHTPAAFGQRTVLSAAALDRRAQAGAGGENDSYALEVLSRLLGRGRTSRLSRALVDTGLALEASAWNWASRDPGLFQIVANVRPGVAVERVRDEIERAVQALADRGPEPAEIERARAQIAVQRAFARDGTLGLAQRLGEFEAVGSWRLDDDYLERVDEVTPERVRDAARAYLHDDNRTVGTLVPGTAKTFDVVPFEPVEERSSADDRVESAALPAPREQRSAPFASRVAAGTAGNGLAWRYVEIPQTATVHVRGLFAAGPAFAPGRPLLPTVVAELLSRGTRAHERKTIEERLELAGVRRAYGVDDDAAGSDVLAFRFVAAATAAELPLVLETLAEELREPRFDPDELALVKAELAGSLKLARTSTNWRAMQRFLELTYEANDPNAGHEVDGLLATLDAIDVDDVREFWQTRIAQSQPLVSAAGAPATALFARMLAATLGDGPPAPGGEPKPGEAIVIRPLPSRSFRADVELERKASVDIVIGRATTLVRASDDYLAAAIANGILGQSTLSSRLGLQLRDREGLTYGVTSAFLGGGKLPGPWRIGVSVNPANVDRAIASAREVLEQYAAHGPTERELIQQRNSMAGSQAVGLATNSGIAAQLERTAYFGLPEDYVDTYRSRLESVGRGDVNAAIARYLAPDDLAVAAAGTFAPAIAAR